MIREDDSPVSKMRDMILRHLNQGFADFTGRPHVATSLYPWDSTETPRLIVHQDVDFARSDDDAGPCLTVCRFAVMFVAGPMGDGVGQMADWWSQYMLQPDLFAGITADEWWNESEPVPFKERVGGFRLYEMPDGHMVASESIVRTEIHTERAV